MSNQKFQTVPSEDHQETGGKSETLTSATSSQKKADNSLHIVIQGKGGVGKSYIATIIAMYLKKIGRDPACFDTDPVNRSFRAFKGLGATAVDLMTDGGAVDEGAFDQIFEAFVKGERDVVVDNGATSFIPLFNYLTSTGVLEQLAEMGTPATIHTVIAGGEALLFTLDALSQLAAELPEGTKLIVWLNEYFGPIQISGHGFEELTIYQELKSRIHGIVTLRAPRSEMFASDIRTVRQRGLTFEEAMADSSIFFVNRCRIKMVEREIFSAVANVM